MPPPHYAAQLWIFAGNLGLANFSYHVTFFVKDYRFTHTTYYANQEVTLQHLFIKDWDQTREIQAYPPATGKLALYSKPDLIKYIDYAITSWANVETSSLAPFFRNSSLSLCVKHYGASNITKDLAFSLAAASSPPLCIQIEAEQVDKFNNSVEMMEENNFTVQWYIMKKLDLKFSLNSINLHPSTLHQDPECYKFQAELSFDNTEHDGQVPIYLKVKPARIQCSSDIKR